MFDIGWTEMLVVACVAIIVVGPKDLPKVLRGFGRAMKSIRGLAGDFQKQFDEAVKEADLDEVKNMASGKGFSPLEDVKKSVSDFEKDVKEQMSARSREMDEAMEAESVGLPEPVSTKPPAKVAEPLDKTVSVKTKTTAKKKTAQKASAGKPRSTPAKSSTAKPAPAKAKPKASATKTAAVKKSQTSKTSPKAPKKTAKSA